LLPDRSFLGDPEALTRLNPNKIYTENVRSVLGVSSKSAKRIIDTAVRQGVFQRCVEVVCPGGAVAASAESEDKLPDTVRCWKEEDGNHEEVLISTRELSKSVFYRLKDEAASRESHTQPA
jgi:hypothetical protein